VRGALAISVGLVRVSLNSRKRLDRLLRILSKLGADPMVVSETHDPAQDMVFGSTAQLLTLAGRAVAAPEGWAKAWLDEPVPALPSWRHQRSGAECSREVAEQGGRQASRFRRLRRGQ
jgi:hypothetical protein